MSDAGDQVAIELRSLALHEAGHCVTAVALGCRVTSVSIRLRHNSLLGLTAYTLQADTRPSARIAILLSGLLAQRDYKHLKLEPPCIRNLSMTDHTAQSKQPSRLARAIAGYGINQKSVDGALLPDGDMAQVRQILADRRHPDQCFARAEKIAHSALAANELPLRLVAQSLLAVGTLRGAHLGGLLASVAKIGV